MATGKLSVQLFPTPTPTPTQTQCISQVNPREANADAVIFLRDAWCESAVEVGHVLHVIWRHRGGGAAAGNAGNGGNGAGDDGVIELAGDGGDKTGRMGGGVRIHSSGYYDSGAGGAGGGAGGLPVIVIDDEHHWLVVEPDILVSPSNVSSAITCERAAVLSMWANDVRGGSGKPAALGNLKHDAFEHVVSTGDFSWRSIVAAGRRACARRMPELVAAGLTDAEIHKAMSEAATQMQWWGQSCCTSMQGDDGDDGDDRENRENGANGENGGARRD